MLLRKKHKNVIFWLMLSALMLPAFNNCSGGFSTERLDAAFLSSMSFSSLNLSGKCESQLVAVYQASYHPFLQTNCGSCHVPGGGGAGNFAVADVGTSFNEFMAKGNSRINNNSIGSHKPPNTGTQHTNAINTISNAWSTGISAYNQCVVERDAVPGAGGGPGEVIIPIDQGTIPTADTVITSNKRGPVGYISASPVLPLTNGAPNYTNYTGWRTIDWNLNLDVVSPSKQYQATISIDIAPYVAIENGQQVKRGFVFRNPRARLAAAGGPALRFQKVFVHLNGQLVGTMTSYSSVDMIVSSTTATSLLASTAGFGLLATNNPPSDADDIALQIQTLTVSNGGGTPVVVPTFAQLTGNDANFNVFRTSCFSCHSGGNIRGGLNLSDYNSTISKGSQIVARMKNAQNPMPPQGGLLPAARVRLVEDWVNANYPQ